MGEVVAAAAAAGGLFSVWHFQPLFCPSKGLCFGPVNLTGKRIKKQNRLCRGKPVLSSQQQPKTFHYRYTIDAAFYESPEASFDQYLEDEHRAFRAIIPDKETTQINAEEWRIHMPAMQVLFLSIYLVVYAKLRCKSMGKDYPAHIPQDISKIIELDITRWEMLGSSADLHSTELSLSVKGTIFSDRPGAQSRLRNVYDINLSFVVTPLFAWVPDDVTRSITDSLVKTVMDNMKTNALLLADYDKFKREKKKL